MPSPVSETPFEVAIPGGVLHGHVGGEGRSGEAYAVVSADGSLPLPPAAVDAFPPGALVRVAEVDGVWTLIPQGRGESGE